MMSLVECSGAELATAIKTASDGSIHKESLCFHEKMPGKAVCAQKIDSNELAQKA